jgi:hypothetical protein
MSNTVSESNSDADLGSGGAMVLPPLNDRNGNPVTLAVGAGKDSHIYVVDISPGKMGKFSAIGNAIYQQLSGALPGGVWSSPAWFGNKLYYGDEGQTLKAFTFANGAFQTTPSSYTANVFGYPGATPSISANGTANAIVWAVESSESLSAAVLHAFDASDLSHELYNSNQAADDFGAGNKFIVPTVVNGKVYVGTTNGVGVFGLLPGAGGGTKAAMVTPVPGSVLSRPAVTFTWNSGTGPMAYWLDVGTVPGQGNIFGQNVGLVTSQAVSGIPVTGVPIYVRLWSQINGAWLVNDYTYTASLGTEAAMSTPVPGSVLSGSTGTFAWSAGTEASAYWLDVGTALGQGNIFGQNVGLVTSQTVNNIPSTGQIIYVQLWTLINGTWNLNRCSCTAAPGTPSAVMSNPTPGSTLSGSNVMFTWTLGTEASAYWLDVGTALGQGNIFGQNVGLVTSQTINSIPTTGQTIYVQLWTLIDGTWNLNRYTYTAATSNRL